MNGSADTCSDNPDGDTVCSRNTLTCGPPGAFQPCAGGAGGSCASGFVCVPINGGVCVQQCQQTSDCTVDYAQCLPSPIGSLCQVIQCGPGSGPDAGAYYDACDLPGTDGGWCEPIANPTGGIIGLCMQAGSIPTEGYCAGFGVSGDEQCVPGDICFSFGLRFRDGGVAQQCFQACDASATENTCAGSEACFPINSSAQTVPDPGYCFP